MRVPNVVLLVGDCLRAASVDEETMPFATNFADISLDPCYAPGTWTLPTHATLFSGRSPPDHGVTQPGDSLHEGQTEVVRRARANGYTTALFSENPTFGRRTGFQHHVDYVDDAIHFKPFPSSFSPANHVDGVSLRDGLNLVRELVRRPRRGRNLANAVYGWFSHRRDDTAPGHPHHGDRVLSHLDSFLSAVDGSPTFVVTNLLDTHNPHHTRPEFGARELDVSVKHEESRALAAADNFDFLVPDDPALPSEAEQVFGSWEAIYDRKHAVYRTQVRYLDSLLERWVDRRQQAFLDESLVVVTGDHGQLFGEEGHVEHQVSLHPHAVRVPLLVSFPAGWGSVPSTDGPVSLTSLSRTIAGVLDATVSDARAFVEDLTVRRPVVTVADGPTVGIERLRDRYGRAADDVLAVRKYGEIDDSRMVVYESRWSSEEVIRTEYALHDGTRSKSNGSEVVAPGDAPRDGWLRSGSRHSGQRRVSDQLEALGYV